MGRQCRMIYLNCFPRMSRGCRHMANVVFWLHRNATTRQSHGASIRYRSIARPSRSHAQCQRSSRRSSHDFRSSRCSAFRNIERHSKTNRASQISDCLDFPRLRIRDCPVNLLSSISQTNNITTHGRVVRRYWRCWASNRGHHHRQYDSKTQDAKNLFSLHFLPSFHVSSIPSSQLEIGLGQTRHLLSIHITTFLFRFEKTELFKND